MWSDITDVFLKSAFPEEADSGSYQDFKQLYRAFKEQIWQESNVKKYRGKIEKMYYGVSCGKPAGLQTIILVPLANIVLLAFW